MPAEGKVFKLSEVKEHNVSKGEAKSIWVVIHDKVYDITKFLDEVSPRLSPASGSNLPLYSTLEARRS